MVITQGLRIAIREAHDPAGSRGLCAVCHERHPCAAVQLLAELETVEAAARKQHEHIAELRRRNSELETKIRRAMRELS